MKIALATMVFAMTAIVCAGAARSESEILRVGGSYQISTIDQMDSGIFRVEFRSPTPSGRFDILVLETDHVNFAVQTRDEVRLSAEVLKEEGEIAEVAQVLLFLPSAQGYLPVWLLSSKGSAFDLRGARYLEMHAPASDYQLF